MQFIKLFSVAFIYAFILDMIWLGFIAKNIYAKNLGDLLKKSGDVMTPNWPAAMLVYVFIAVGVVCFVLPKANGNFIVALGWGALFGAVAYGIYDFTNYATLANWPLNVTLIDLVWGAVLCGMTSSFTTYMQQWFNA